MLLFNFQLRKYGIGKNKKIDDYQYGGGFGMVLKIEPIYKCINKLKKKIFYDEVIFLSPDGEKLNQLMVNNLSKKKNLIIICGHYKGIDQRIRDNLVTKEISIGDYVISCGEIASIVLIDSIIRILPGVINKKSFIDDSIQNGLKTSYPIYTRPYKYKNLKVPNILISGNHKKIKEWRNIQLLKKIEKNNKNKK
ncbi:tRNA (guanosine(37)-N1)-methyltransferase TrmD [Candidatus Shikimatogenerans silvanidophilus]|uniref:tRNA (guanosine(37)-N1)-methyltransferase TrmD n=1 Tax=Candidatus Shikimatogenerans silvanidophilus TaxID=2782547 RepID=UPI001BADD9F3|nr:tRNA (guanosine(37)-N1)-methyltransferase TrmD [Candidatus Shikimatogenerans silvanidophilus]